MKNNKLNYLFSFLAMVLSSGLLMIPSNQDPIPIDSYEMGQRIAQKLEADRSENIVDDLTDLELWSTIISTDSLLEIVYKPSTFRGDVIEDDVEYDINSPAFRAARSQVLNLLQDKSSKSSNTSNIVYEDDEAPIIVVRVNSYNNVTALRRSKNVQTLALGGITSESQVENAKSGRSLIPGKNKSFLDGLGIDIRGGDGDGAGERDGSGWFGCANNEASDINLLPDNDANGTVRVPWHYDEMGILEANDCTAGAGIKITMLDTGISDDQYNLSTNGFNDGYPSRTISKSSTVNGGVDDNCGHGTLMAGVIAGPASNAGVRGVAYKSNFVSIRSNKDVLLVTWIARNNLRQALKKIRKSQSGTSGTKVVSMSLGYLSYSAMVAFELKKVDKKGILMFGAIGTSKYTNFQWIQVYPAKSKRVTGVTGVYSGYPSLKKRCDKCHWGNKVEFVVPMQIDDSGTTTHSLMMEGTDPAKVGGSSIATATMAGVAAMVWSLPQNQNKDGDEIKDILRAASTAPNNKHPKFGHGVVDVMQATGCTPDPCEGVVCPPETQCVNGICLQDQNNGPCNSDGDCPPGMICVNGFCSWDLNCGPGLPPCPPGEQCIGGHCIPL